MSEPQRPALPVIYRRHSFGQPPPRRRFTASSPVFGWRIVSTTKRHLGGFRLWPLIGKKVAANSRSNKPRGRLWRRRVDPASSVSNRTMPVFTPAQMQHFAEVRQAFMQRMQAGEMGAGVIFGHIALTKAAGFTGCSPAAGLLRGCR